MLVSHMKQLLFAEIHKYIFNKRPHLLDFSLFKLHNRMILYFIYTVFKESAGQNPPVHTSVKFFGSVFDSRKFHLFILLFMASYFRPRFLAFWHPSEGLSKCLRCHTALPSIPPLKPYQSRSAHPSPQPLSLGNQLWRPQGAAL